MKNFSRIKYFYSWFGLGLLLTLSVFLVILDSFSGTNISIIFIGAILIFCYFIISVINPEIIIYVAIFISGLSGSLSLIKVDYIPISLSGFLTGFLIVNVVIVILSRIKYQSWINSIKSYWHFYPFLLVMLLRIFTGEYLFNGFKLFLLFLTPLLVGIVARREIFRGIKVRQRVEKALLFIPLLPILVILMNILGGTLQSSTLGFQTVIGLGLGPRPLALFLLPILALMIGKWRYNKRIKEKSLLIIGSLAITAVIVTSLSRVASVIALLVIIPSRFLKKWYHPTTFVTIVIGVGILLYWVSLPSIQQRFFPGGLESAKFDISSFQSIDTQGRRNLWILTWNNAIDTPIFGKGTGSAGHLVLSTYPPLEHPHNDFLRVFHDMGLVGLISFLFAWSIQILHNFKYWIIFDKRRNNLAYYHLAAMIATIAICITFFTDNTITYVFVLIPLNIIYGLADSSIKEEFPQYQREYSR